jgi:hypothetical protein
MGERVYGSHMKKALFDVPQRGRHLAEGDRTRAVTLTKEERP